MTWMLKSLLPLKLKEGKDVGPVENLESEAVPDDSEGGEYKDMKDMAVADMDSSCSCL